MSEAKNAGAPKWAMDPFEDFTTDISHLGQILEMSVLGISTFRAMPQLVAAVGKAHSRSEHEDTFTSLAAVESHAAFAEREMENGFPVLHTNKNLQRFHRERRRHPHHGEGGDIFERLYAVRLDRIRADPECLELLKALDTDGLLAPADEAGDTRSDDELLDALGVAAVATDTITVLKHVRPTAERASPEEVAQREPCRDFEQFRAQFDAAQAGIVAGRWRTVPFKGGGDAKILLGDWFILDGEKAYVAGAEEAFVQDYGETDRRLRVVFDNGTESDLLLRSLRRALNEDEQSRRIVPPDVAARSLFSDEPADDDDAAGTIYVARSLSGHPFIAANRDVLHKIGVTSGDPKRRVAGAKADPTFLLADAELVAVYSLANLHGGKLERALHKLFAAARLDIELKDRFGGAVEPREWFLVPLGAINEAVARIKYGSIERFRYEPEAGRLVPA